MGRRASVGCEKSFRRRDVRKLLFLCVLLTALCVFPGSVKGQAPVDRVARRIDMSARVRRAGSHHPLARPEFDAGRLAPDTRLERMVLTLRPDARQEQQLEKLLADQQDSSSPLFHQWLTPEDYGRQFGLSDHDLNQVVRWLEDQGFDVEPVDDSRRQVIFSGTAGQVESAFRTEMHRYRVNGAIHHANASDLEIPTALDSVIGGVVSLHDFHSKPMHARIVPTVSEPQYTSGSGTHYLAPGDFAAIFNLGPLYGSSTNGSGQSIAVAARSNMKLADVQAFRTKFGLPAINPIVTVNGSDPGVLSSDEQSEVELDTEWSGAVAPNATIQVVISASTSTTDGVALSAQYIVNHNLAPIVSVSFGNCESSMSRTENQFWNGLWQQAASQGMSVFVASGDSGAAACDAPSSTTGTMTDVNGLCSSPYSTCVGGTQFNDTASPTAYWSSSNFGNSTSATGYIPEVAWNESGANGGTALWSTGGGASRLYAKPSWQSGSGVPADGHRDVPDVSLPSSAHDGALFNMNGQFYVASGTSVATPSFAGIMALLDQRQNARQGSANPSLYTLAANQAHGGSAVFHDITGGNNSVPGITGFSAGPGYDLATGLGSVDANLLVNAWKNGSAPPPPCTYSLSGSSATLDAIAQALSVTLTASSSSCTWTAMSDSSWLVITSGAAGTGSQTVTFSVTANPSSSPRTGTLTLAGLPLTVTQAGAACTYAVTAGPMRSNANGYYGWLAVSAPGGCVWTAVSTASWIRVLSGASGSGNGTVSFLVAPNTNAARSGIFTVAGYTLTVTEGARSRLGVARPPTASGNSE